MPSRIPTARGRFAPEKSEVRRTYDADARRREAKRFYASTRWRRLRAAILAESPLCSRCPPDRPTPAVEVHHREPRDVAPERELDPENLEGLCSPCHKRTRSEDIRERTARA